MIMMIMIMSMHKKLLFPRSCSICPPPAAWGCAGSTVKCNSSHCTATLQYAAATSVCVCVCVCVTCLHSVPDLLYLPLSYHFWYMRPVVSLPCFCLSDTSDRAACPVHLL